jgi:hypothetical protein
VATGGQRKNAVGVTRCAVYDEIAAVLDAEPTVADICSPENAKCTAGGAYREVAVVRDGEGTVAV